MRHNEDVIDRARLETLAAGDRDLSPDECAALARAASGLVSPDELDRDGHRAYELLWRTIHSEAWLNTQREDRDTGFHDHAGSCVGVHVLRGRVRNEALVVGAPRRISEHGAGESFSFPGTGIHRMDHDVGAVTIHVYSPPIREIGHYDVVDGELRREPGSPDHGSEPSPGLEALLSS